VGDFLNKKARLSMSGRTLLSWFLKGLPFRDFMREAFFLKMPSTTFLDWEEFEIISFAVRVILRLN
jgi:hypothetical protein